MEVENGFIFALVEGSHPARYQNSEREPRSKQKDVIEREEQIVECYEVILYHMSNLFCITSLLSILVEITPFDLGTGTD